MNSTNQPLFSANPPGPCVEPIRTGSGQELLFNTKAPLSDYERFQRRLNRMAEALNKCANECPHCNGAGQDNDGEAYIDACCPKCIHIYNALAYNGD